MFNTLNTIFYLKECKHIFYFLYSSLSYINLIIYKVRNYPDKALYFGDLESYYSMNILGECSITIKLKLNITK